MEPYRKSLQLLELKTTTGEQREVLEKGKKQAGGMVPNMYMAMANAPELLETYMFGYDRFRAQSGFTPAEQEVILLMISAENECEYCVAGHSLAADMISNVPEAVSEAIRTGAEIPDAKLRVVGELTRSMLLSRGMPPQEDVEAFLAAGYQEKQILDIILAISIKTLSNYTNHMFGTPLDGMFKIREWKAFKIANRANRFVRRIPR